MRTTCTCKKGMGFGSGVKIIAVSAGFSEFLGVNLNIAFRCRMQLLAKSHGRQYMATSRQHQCWVWKTSYTQYRLHNNYNHYGANRTNIPVTEVGGYRLIRWKKTSTTAKVQYAQDINSLRNSVSTEMLQGLRCGRVLSIAFGGAFTCTDNGVPDCNGLVNRESCESMEYADKCRCQRVWLDYLGRSVCW